MPSAAKYILGVAAVFAIVGVWILRERRAASPHFDHDAEQLAHQRWVNWPLLKLVDPNKYPESAMGSDVTICFVAGRSDLAFVFGDGTDPKSDQATIELDAYKFDKAGRPPRLLWRVVGTLNDLPIKNSRPDMNGSLATRFGPLLGRIIPATSAHELEEPRSLATYHYTGTGDMHVKFLGSQGTEKSEWFDFIMPGSDFMKKHELQLSAAEKAYLKR